MTAGTQIHYGSFFALGVSFRLPISSIVVHIDIPLEIIVAVFNSSWGTAKDDCGAHKVINSEMLVAAKW